ncbi:MAG: CoA pyrophosphatase [Fervidobacterium sp.]
MKFLGEYNYYAVCAPIYQDKLIFEVRSPYVTQPLEVSFPGGRIENGESPYMAAVRELKEEINVDILRKISDIEPIVTPFNTVVFSYVVEIGTLDFKINKFEVSEVFAVPINFFAEPFKKSTVDIILQPPDDFPYDLIPNGRNYPWKKGRYDVIFYKWNDHIIWGITARIAKRAYEILKNGL